MTEETVYQMLKSLLYYSEEEGVFYWKKTGKIAGTLLKDGRIQIQLKGKLYKAHRLAWLYVHGRWPSDQIDHINRNPSDNRIDNLREATQSQNQQNQVNAKSHNKSRLLGASLDKERGTYASYLSVDGKRIFLGRFLLAEEAHSAYLEAKSVYHDFYSKGV